MNYKVIEDGEKNIYCTEKCDIFVRNKDSHEELELFDEEISLGEKEIPTLPSKLKKLIILLSTACNLRCRYCYLSYGIHAGDEIVHNIKVEYIKTLLEMVIKKYPKGIGFIQFFGGEPLVAFKELKEIYKNVCEFFDERGMKRPIFGVVTNGLLINEEVIDFFNQSNMGVTVSIDGDRNIHDLVRKKVAQGSAYDDLQSIFAKYKNRISFPLYFEMTLNREHVMNYQPEKMKKWLQSVKELGFSRGIIGIVEYSMDSSLNLRKEDIPVLEKIYREFVNFFFDELENNQPGIYNLDVCKLIQMIICKDLRYYSCNTGIEQMTLATNGTIYPCPKFATVDMSIGSVKDQSLQQDGIRQIIVEDKREKCNTCWMRQMCKSYCYSLEYRKQFDPKAISVRCLHLDNLLTNVIRNMVDRRLDAKFKDIVKKSKYILSGQEI